jgi:nitrogen fixation/metabolism regulation signal transduction histidine kinase
VSLRARLTLYLALLHVALAALAVPLLWAGERVWILPLEALLVASFLVGLRLVRAAAAPFEIVRSGRQHLAESEFAVRFRETGRREVDALVGVYNEMADRLREERTRAEERNFFLERVVDAAPAGVVILDFDGRVALANPAAERLFRRRARELAGLSLAEIGGPLAEALASLDEDEARVVSLWGSRRVRCQRLHFLDRGFSRACYLVDELTEELRRSERAAYEKLVRIMSHEVNNTVAATSSLLDSCKLYATRLEGEEREDFETALDVVIARAAQLAAFMDGFADVARLPEPRPTTVDLRALLGGVERLMRAECERRRIAWRWAWDERVGTARADAAQMEQVFINVVKNAIESIGEEGTVTVRATRENGRAAIAVEDTGPGIAADVREQLFTPFFSTKANGRGVGLTMVHEILSNHGFTFSLDSSAGEPTRFTIYL